MNLSWTRRPQPLGTTPGAESNMHARHTTFTVAVDPSYWPRALSLRVLIAVSYFVLIPAGLLPMSTPWWLFSGGGLLGYSNAALVYHRQWPNRTWLHTTASPCIDTLMVTLATVALARPSYPIWIGYLIIVSSLSVVQTTRYVVLFAVWAVAVYWAGIFVLDVTGRADPSWQIATVVSIMLMFTAMNSEVISTSNRRLQKMVLHASLTDPLTGLANRRRFREILDSHHAPDSRPLAVLMYDVDNFKQINEEYGHVHADRVLVEICSALRAVMRDADVVARYGGDELIVLAHVASVEEAAALGERSLAHIRSTTSVELSLGVAVYPMTAATIDEAVEAADRALGEAKRGGKARVAIATARSAA